MQQNQTEEMILVDRKKLQEFAEMLNAFQIKYFGENTQLNIKNKERK
jgi:hypothetical protein